jgi:hypothetical protein
MPKQLRPYHNFINAIFITASLMCPVTQAHAEGTARPLPPQPVQAAPPPGSQTIPSLGADVHAFGFAQARLGAEIVSTLAKDGKASVVMVSPLSLATALAMIASGADVVAVKAISDVLHLKLRACCEIRNWL